MRVCVFVYERCDVALCGYVEEERQNERRGIGGLGIKHSEREKEREREKEEDLLLF